MRDRSYGVVFHVSLCDGGHVTRIRAARIVILGAAAAVAEPAAASRHGWSQASGIGRDVLVGAALLVPATQGDWKGDLQAGESLLLAGGISYGLKEVVHEERPDHSDDKSFPSGHTSLSFAAAMTLEKRYGWQIGVPALAIASFVGLGRVEARKHHWYDAVAGAAIGSASGFFLTSPRDERVRLIPWADTSGGGFTLAARF